MSLNELPTIEDVRAAAIRIKNIVRRTPLLTSEALREATGARVFLKAESLQHGGAFKLRGATNKIASLSEQERAEGLLAYSSGNHAIGVAMAAKHFNTHALIVMPADAPRAKLETVRALGAEVRLFDRATESREAISAEIAQNSKRVLVKPFDDPLVIAGQGTVGLEISEDIQPDIVLVPASGAGLACGVALATPNAKVYAVEPEGHDDIGKSLAAGVIIANAPGIRSKCDALMVERMGDVTFPLAQRVLAGAFVVSDDNAFAAMRFAFQHFKLVLEPSGAIALAALLSSGVPDVQGKTVAIVASGGNVDADFYARVLAND